MGSWYCGLHLMPRGMGIQEGALTGTFLTLDVQMSDPYFPV